MVDKKTMIVGFLTLIILASIVYIQLNDNVKMRVDEDKTTFYIKLLDDNGEPYGRWLVSGREISSIWDGSTKLNRKSSEIEVNTTINDNFVTITRVTPYIRGPVIKDTYEFDGSLEDVTQFPVSHTIEVINGSGYIYQYEVQDLTYTGETIKDITSPQSFEKNMKIEWQDGNYYSKIYKYKNEDKGKLTIKYRPESDYETYSIRLFDPPINDTTTVIIKPNIDDGDEMYVMVFNLTNNAGYDLHNITFTEQASKDLSKINITPESIDLSDGESMYVQVDYNSSGDTWNFTDEYRYLINNSEDYTGILKVIINSSSTYERETLMLDSFDRIDCRASGNISCWGGSPDIGGIYKFVDTTENKSYSLISKKGTINITDAVTSPIYVRSQFVNTNITRALFFNFSYVNNNEGGFIELYSKNDNLGIKFINDLIVFYDGYQDYDLTTVNYSLGKVRNEYAINIYNDDLYVDVFINDVKLLTADIRHPYNLTEARFGVDDTDSLEVSVSDIKIDAYLSLTHTDSRSTDTIVNTVVDDFRDKSINTTLWSTYSDGDYKYDINESNILYKLIRNFSIYNSGVGSMDYTSDMSEMVQYNGDTDLAYIIDNEGNLLYTRNLEDGSYVSYNLYDDSQLGARGENASGTWSYQYLTLFNTADYSIIGSKSYGNDKRAITFSNNGQLVATSSAAGYLAVYNTTDFSTVKTISGLGGELRDIAFNPDDTHLALGHTNTNVYIFNMSNNYNIMYTLTDSSAATYRLDYSDNGEKLAVGNYDGEVLIYNTSGYVYDRTINFSDGRIRNVIYAENDTQLIVGDEDGLIYVYNTSDYSILKNVTGIDERMFYLAVRDGTLISAQREGDIYHYRQDAGNMNLYSEDNSGDTQNYAILTTNLYNVNLNNKVNISITDLEMESGLQNTGDAYYKVALTDFVDTSDWKQFNTVDIIYDGDGNYSNNIQNLDLKIYPESDELQWSDDFWATNTSVDISSLNNNMRWGLYFLTTGKDTGGTYNNFANISMTEISFSNNSLSDYNPILYSKCNTTYYNGTVWRIPTDFANLATALADSSVLDKDVILGDGIVNDGDIVIDKQVCIDGLGNGLEMDTAVINNSNIEVYNVDITDTKLRFGRDDDEITIEILDGFENTTFDNIGFSALTGPGDGDDLRAIYDNGEKNNRFTNLEFSTITGGNGASHTGADGDDGGDVMLYYGYSDNTLLENISFEYMKTGNGGNGYESNDDDCRDGGNAGHNSKVIYSQGNYLTVRNLHHTATDGLLGGNGGSGECDSGAYSCASGGYPGQFADIISVGDYANLYDITINGYTEGVGGAQDCSYNARSGVSVSSSVDTIQGDFVIVDNVTFSDFTFASGTNAIYGHTSSYDRGGAGGSGDEVEINIGTYSNSKISNVLITDWQLGGGGDAVQDCDDAGSHCGYVGGSSSELTAYIGSNGLGSAENITIRDITQGIGGMAQTSSTSGTYCKESGDNNYFDFYIEFNDYTNFSMHDLTIPNGKTAIDSGDNRGGAGGDTENILTYFDNPITPIEEDGVHIYNITIGTGGTGTCTPTGMCRDGASGDYVFDVVSDTNISNIIIQDIKTGGDASGGCACTSTTEQSHCGGIRILDFSGDQPALDDSSYADQVMYSGALRNLTVSNLNASDWVWGFGAYEEIDDNPNYGLRWWTWNPSPDKIIKSYHPYTTEDITWFTSSTATGNYTLYYSLEPEGDMTLITTNTVDYFCPGQGTTNPNCNYTWDTSGLDKEYYYIMINNTDWETTVPGNATNVFSPSYYYLVGAVDVLDVDIESYPSGRIYQDTTLIGYCNATTDTIIGGSRLSNITYNYTWYNDTGIVSSGTTSGNYLSGYRANINNLSDSLTTIHSNYTLECVGIDEEGNYSLPINSTSAYINENPIITSTARLVPTVTKEYDEIDEIQVWCNASSYAGTDIGHRVDWYKDSILDHTNTSSVIYASGVEVNPFNLTIGHDEIGTWHADCRAFDARFPYTYDTAVESNSVDIVSEMIYARPGQITPNPAYINSILNGYCNATHADGYSMGYNYTWIVDGVSVETGTNNNGSSLFASDKLVFIDSLPLEYTDEGDVVNFECMAWDANGYTGNKTNTTITIANTPPNLVSVRIRPTNATVNSTLVGEVLFNDLDEGYATVYYNWYNNSVLYKSGEVQVFPGITNDISTILQSEVNLGDVWKFEVKINDSVNIINWTNSTESHVLSHTIEINHTADNWDMELADRDLTLNISGTILGETACLDITSDRYTETNIACSTENVSTLFTVPHSYFLRNTFINGTLKENLTFTGGETRVAQFVAHEYDEVENLTFNLTGYDVGGVYPTDIVIRVNGNEIASIGEIYDSDEVIKDKFYSGNDYKEHLFSGPEVAIVDYVNIPKTATVNDLTFNITGIDEEYNWLNMLDYVGASGYGGQIEGLNNNFGQSFTSTVNGTITVLGTRGQYFSSSYDNNGFLSVGTSYSDTSIINNVPFVITAPSWGTGYDFYNWSYKTGLSGNIEKNTKYYTYFTDFAWLDMQYIPGEMYPSGEGYAASYPLSHWGYNRDLLLYINVTSYPWDLWIDVGDIESSHAWSHADILNDEQEVSGFVSQINSYLTDCTADDYGMCQVPIYVYSDNGGMINLTDLVINYTYNPNPITADIEEFSSFLITQDKYHFVDLDVTSATAGIVEISSLQYKYAGGKDTYEVTLHNPTYTTSVGIDLNQYYSKWDYELPANIDYIDFYPWAPDAKNVTPFAQSDSIPIMNVSNYAYGGKNFTFWSTINNSEACVDLYINDNNSKNTDVVTENVWNITKTNSVYDTTFGIWMWTDLSCSTQQWYNWYPDYHFRACCDECDWCDTTLE